MSKLSTISVEAVRFAAALTVAFAATMAFGDTYTSEGYLQDGLIAQWDGINNTGLGYHVPDAAVWKDIAGTYDLTLLPRKGWVSGRPALNVENGTAQGTSAAPAYRTIEIFYKMTVKEGRILFCSGRNKQFVLFASNGTKGYFSANKTASKCATWTFNATALRSMAATYDASSVVDAVYRDGVAVNDGVFTDEYGVGDGKIMIGDRVKAGSVYWWKGEVYAIRLYSTELTAEQIAANHAVDVARFSSAIPRMVEKPNVSAGNVVVRYTAGQTGDSHVLRLLWDTTGVDYGSDYASWPNNDLIGNIADNATSSTIPLPAAALAANRICCRVLITKQDGTPAAISLPFAANSINDVDYVLDGPMVFAASPGYTNVYTGLISGTGPAIIEGGGTVAFSHANNTYTGGTIVSNAVFRLDADGCAGTGAITGAVNSAHIYLNCARVPNSFRFLAGYGNNASAQADGQYPPAGGCPIFPITSPVTVTGSVSFADTTIYTSGSSNKTTAQNPTVTYEGDFTVDAGKNLTMSTYGKTIFKGRYASDASYNTRTQIGLNSSAQGSVEFHSPSNRIRSLITYNGKIYLYAKDAIPESQIFCEYGQSYFNMYLNGFDQTVRSIQWSTEAGYFPNPGETATYCCLLSDDEATFRITGGTLEFTSKSTWVNRMAVNGKITLVMDVAPTYAASGFFQDFSVRKSTTTGDLIISNGDFRVSGTASFPNVPNIYVGEGGSFSNSSTRAAAFAGCTNLTVLGKMTCTGDATPFGYKTMDVTLGENAEFSLPAGATATVLSLKVGDTDLPDGTYGDDGTAVAQIKRGTVVVQGLHTAISRTWTGGGGVDASIGTAANWGSDATPNLGNASLVATFATGGTTADIDRDLSLRGIVLSKPDTGFSFTGAHVIALDADGIAFNDATPAADGSPRLYSFEPVVQQLSALNQSFTIPTNVTVDFAGGYLQTQPGANLKTGDGTLMLGGNGGTPGSWRFDGGSVEFTGTNQIDGAIAVTNATVKFSGVITRAGGPDTSTHYYGWKPSANDVVIYCKPRANNIPVSRIILDNADFSKVVGIYCPGLDAGEGWFTVQPGSTNIFRSLLCLKGYIGYINLGAGSETTFAGALASDGQTDFRGSGTIVLKGSSPYFSGGGLRIRDNNVCRIENSGQCSGGGNLILQEHARLELAVDNAFSMNPSRDYWILLYEAGVTLDLGGTVQNLVLFGTDSNNNRSGSGGATITGLPGSELRIRRGYIFHNVTNCVSLTASGTNVNEVLVATNKAFASFGDVKAASGVLEFGANASWRNGTNVTVCGGATLRINRSATFGEHAVLRAEGSGWTMSLGNGVHQKFAEFYIDGQRQPNGTYGATGNAAAKYSLSNFTGAGVIKVGKLGTTFLIR